MKKVYILILIFILSFAVTYNVYAETWHGENLPNYSNLIQNKSYCILFCNSDYISLMINDDVNYNFYLYDWYYGKPSSTAYQKQIGICDYAYKLDNGVWKKFDRWTYRFLKSGSSSEAYNLTEEPNYYIYKSNNCIYTDSSKTEVFYTQNSCLKGDINDEWWIEVPPEKSIHIKNDLDMYTNNSSIELYAYPQSGQNKIIGYEFCRRNGDVITQEEIYTNAFSRGLYLYKNEEMYIKNTTNEILDIFMVWGENSAPDPTVKVPFFEILDSQGNYFDEQLVVEKEIKLIKNNEDNNYAEITNNSNIDRKISLYSFKNSLFTSNIIQAFIQAEIDGVYYTVEKITLKNGNSGTYDLKAGQKIKIYQNIGEGRVKYKNWKGLEVYTSCETNTFIDDGIVACLRSYDEFKDKYKDRYLVDEMINKVSNSTGINVFTKSLDKLKYMKVEKGQAPTIKINVHKMIKTVTDGLGFKVDLSTMTDEELTIIDFGYLEIWKFMGYSIIDYFRMVIGFGFVIMTVLYGYRKIVPDKAVS